MPIWGRRGLTAGEIALAGEAFAEPIDWRGVAVVQVAPAAPWGAMVPLGRTILFGRWRAALDFARVDLHEQGWFVHELAHVWQAARGTVLAAAKLSAVGHAAYSADWAIERPFSAYNIEQQAEIARFAFLAARGRPDPKGPDLRRLAALWPLSRKTDA
ncbi:MAG: hypothetical protein ACOYM8_17750 [Caulobacterales bacterium]